MRIRATLLQSHGLVTVLFYREQMQNLLLNQRHE